VSLVPAVVGTVAATNVADVGISGRVLIAIAAAVLYGLIGLAPPLGDEPTGRVDTNPTTPERTAHMVHVGHSYMTMEKGTVTGQTANEIIATEHLSDTDPARFYTTGKYQTIIAIFREGAARLGLTGEERYDEVLQERMISGFLIFHAGGGISARFIKQGLGTVDDAQYAASKEWASIAAPAGRQNKRWKNFRRHAFLLSREK
jgi:hypothetical protein